MASLEEEPSDADAVPTGRKHSRAKGGRSQKRYEAVGSDDPEAGLGSQPRQKKFADGTHQETITRQEGMLRKKDHNLARRDSKTGYIVMNTGRNQGAPLLPHAEETKEDELMEKERELMERERKLKGEMETEKGDGAEKLRKVQEELKKIRQGQDGELLMSAKEAKTVATKQRGLVLVALVSVGLIYCACVALWLDQHTANDDLPPMWRRNSKTVQDVAHGMLGFAALLCLGVLVTAMYQYHRKKQSWNPRKALAQYRRDTKCGSWACAKATVSHRQPQTRL